MKHSFVLAAACALVLSACGGGKQQFPVHVTVAASTVAGDGLIYPGLVLTTNGQDLALAPPSTPGAAVSGTFPNTLSYGDVYDITVKTQPAHQACSASAFTHDSAGRYASIDAVFTCAIQSHALTGTVTGLTATGLQLTNGSTGGVIAVPAGATTFTMPEVNYGKTYGVTVLSQPTGQVCTVTNGVGQMGDADVTNLKVTCQ
ncbi:hypothetical protein E4L96_03415 [Massilia arenosa]|uniref:Uncharacterized protein n=1 Tax=Zemynaea arenosa TaxID=2561931 RepID=A0A4Y9SM18_9BURK|nr:hypothetical protein [Massilia arenosa]TFW27700.1 hypothetical protein E4L96_03415 [Massilia arenosa]